MRAFLEKTQASIRETSQSAIRLATTPMKPPADEDATLTSGKTEMTPAQKNKAYLKGLRAQNKKLKHLYTVLSKSKEELGTDLAVFRSFTHQILPTFVAAEKKADETLDADILLAEYHKIAAAKTVLEESSTHGSSAPIDADLLGLNDVQAPNQTEMALRKELVDVVETKDKILGKFREAVNKLRALQQKYNTLAKQTNETNSSTATLSSGDNQEMLSRVSGFEETIRNLKQQLEQESSKGNRLQEKVEEMDTQLKLSKNSNLTESKRAQDAEAAAVQARKEVKKIQASLEHAQIATQNETEQPQEETTQHLRTQVLALEKNLLETTTVAEQVPGLEKHVCVLEAEKTTLLTDKAALETEVEQMRAMHDDLRKQLSERNKDDDDSTENKQEVLTGKMEKLETEKKKLLTKGKELYTKHQKLKQDCTQLQERYKSAKNQVEQLTSSSAALQQDSSELQTQVDNVTKELRATEIKNDASKSELDAKKISILALENKLAEAATKQSAAEEECNTQSVTHASAIQQLEMSMEVKTTELEKLKETLAKKEKEMEEQQSLVESSTASIEEQSNAETTALREEVQTLTASLADGESVKSNLVAVRQQLQELSELHAAEAQSKAMEVEATETEMNVLKKTMEEKLSTVESQKTEFAKKGKMLVTKLKEAKEKFTELENKLAEAATKQVAAEEECNTQSATHASAIQQLEMSMEMKTTELEKLKQKLTSESSTVADEKSRLTSKLGELEDTQKALELKNKKMKESNTTLEQQSEKNQEEWRERMSALHLSLDEMRKTASSADKRTEEHRMLMQENDRSNGQKLSSAQGELRVAHERIERILKTNREKEIEHQERMGALQRSLEGMRHQAASVNAEQDEIDLIQAALESKQAALEDVKKTDRRIITDLKREMSRGLRQSRLEKDEQIMIAEKALTRLRQEEDRAAQLEENVVALQSDLNAKAKEVQMAMLQIENLAALSAGGGGSGGGGSDGGLLSWFTGGTTTPARGPSQGGVRAMGVRHATPRRR